MSSRPIVEHACVLVVDDDIGVREAIRRCCHVLRPGWRVFMAADGHEALRKLRDTSIDVVVTDIMMPGMDGLEFVAAVRHFWPKIPVVAMTGGHPLVGPFLTAARAIGAEAEMNKPVSTRHIIGTIEEVLLARDESWWLREDPPKHPKTVL